MKAKPLTIFSTLSIITWCGIYSFNYIGILTGAGTLFLPFSIVILIITELRSTQKPFNLSIIFLTSCLFFFCSGLILWPLSSFSPLELDGIIVTKFTLNQFDHAATLIGISISITMLTASLCKIILKIRQPFKFAPNPDQHADKLFKFGKILMGASCPIVLYELWGQLKYIQEMGYLTLYTNKIESSITSKLSFYIFYLGFGFALTFAQNSKNLNFPAIIYLTVATLDSLKGVRGNILVPIIFLIWYYRSRFDIKINFSSFSRVTLALISAFVLLTYIRDKDSLIIESIFQLAIDSISTQGRSLQWTALYIDISDQISKYGSYTIFSNLLIPFNALIHPELRESPQSIYQVLYSNNLKHIMTYVLDESYYFAGGGTGGVYTIELIESGPILYVLFSILLGIYLIWLPTAMRHSWIRFLSVYLFTSIFYLPRGEFFFNLLIVGKALLLYIVTVNILHTYYNHKTPRVST